MENKQTPEMRFEGFFEVWEYCKLSEISEKVTEKNKNNIYSETLTNSAEFGIINQRDFFEKDISNEKNLDGYYVVYPDDFVYNPRISNFAPVGPIKRNKLGRTGVMSPLYYVFRTHSVDKTYLEIYFSSTSWHIFMKMNGDSGARSDRFAIKDSLFREMPIPTPSIEEQQKIGSFFKQLDDTIALQQQELDTLKQTKQGFLQKMFPKEGETVPEIRFPGFSGEWEQRKLGDIYNFQYGQFNKNPDNGGEYPVYGANGIIGGYHEYNAEDSVVIGHMGAYAGHVLWASGKHFVTYNGTIGFPKIMDFDEKFGYHMLQHLNIPKITAGSGQPFVSYADLKNIKISLPINFEEQQKIGSFFKQLDDTITLHQRELDTLKETKKAFLQKMFV